MQRGDYAKGCSGKADPSTSHRRPWRQHEDKVGQPEEALITRDHGAPENDTAGDSKRGADDDDEHDELEIMRGKRQIGKTERLERRNLLPLCRHLTADSNIEQKPGNREKEHRYCY